MLVEQPKTMESWWSFLQEGDKLDKGHSPKLPPRASVSRSASMSQTLEWIDTTKVLNPILQIVDSISVSQETCLDQPMVDFWFNWSSSAERRSSIFAYIELVLMLAAGPRQWSWRLSE
jgi:hypothetical protein